MVVSKEGYRAYKQKEDLMNKATVVEEMAKKTKESKATCKRCLESFVDIISDALRKNKPVVLTDFGTFSILERKARTGVNPATRRKMQIPAKKVPKFRPGKALKEKIM